VGDKSRAEYLRAWVAANPERSREIKQRWAEKNRDKIRARRAAWKRNNRAKVAAEVMGRNARRLQATPAWADLDAIQAMYVAAKVMELSFGGKWEVDHIIPLRSKVVCGLHVQNNLRLAPARENRSKGNKFDPECERVPVGTAF